jgi:protein-tyrosine kinase
MGKLSDALERMQNERAIKARMLNPETDTKPLKVIHANVDPKLVAYTAPRSVEAEKFKMLKNQILFSKNGSKPRTIMVTSAFPNEGKTFIAANLAVSLGQGVNEQSLLIDCDFHSPGIHKVLGLSNNAGLQDYLCGKMALPDLLIQTGIDKLSLLTAGRPVQNPSELLASLKMKTFFEEVKGRYPDMYIVVDCAPSHIMSEVTALSNYVDGVIFVVMAHQTPREIIKECIEKLGKEKIFGIVFNGYDKVGKVNDNYYRKYHRPGI